MRKPLFALAGATVALMAPLVLLSLGTFHAPATEAQGPTPSLWAYEVLPGLTAVFDALTPPPAAPGS